MDGGQAQIIERGVLTAWDESWDVAVCQAEVIGRLGCRAAGGIGHCGCGGVRTGDLAVSGVRAAGPVACG
ncbi:hypothetical protein GCM10012289_69960 [Nonomuraea cavernae]|uniref:Uncharacterized protein n=1 Tax=Nonomuraea cavernae TaxID=2045107 RepID=A0A917ZGA1_9ACTN|nr:hypothetical protein GCM10012289_69960 [Nonomuraea cavernae]